MERVTLYFLFRNLFDPELPLKRLVTTYTHEIQHILSKLRFHLIAFYLNNEFLEQKSEREDQED